MHRSLLRAGIVSALLGLSFLPGCGGGGGGSGGADPTLTFAITDSPSDDVQSFTCDVTQLSLRKLGGAIVDVLSTPVTVDLATLTDTSQILSGSTVPPGTYLSATITIDFTNAQCFLTGQTTPATILDDAGNPLTGTLTLPIQFGASPLICPFNRHKLLELDFDLNQSVVTDTSGNTVTMEPVFEMHVDPAAPKVLFAGGSLTSVDTTTNTFVGEIETLAEVPIVSATFHVDANTVYQIDGVPSQGSAGLTALSAVAAGTWFQAYGSIDPHSPELDVTFVEAGTGTYNGGSDIVEGHITDRVGGPGTDPTLTVLGHSNNAAHTIFQFNTSFTVTASFANTKVVRFGQATAYDTDDLNVGQRVRIFGTLAGTTLDATGTRAVARMQPTWVFGHANGAPVVPDLEIDLTRVDFRQQSVFNWSASGTPATDPAHFNLLVNNLGTGLGIVANTPVAARGFFPAIDDTAEDFQASALANLDQVPSIMFIRNRPGGFTVTAAASATQVVVTISGSAGAGEVATIDQPLVGPQPLPTSPNPAIVPSASGPHFFWIRNKSTNSSTMYLVFANWTSALANLVSTGATIDQITAVGVYTGATNTVAAQAASVVVE